MSDSMAGLRHRAAMTVTIEEAEALLSKIVAKAEAGEGVRASARSLAKAA
ncbi:MAG: hypothetical protein AAB676_13875 [Verrucomicrobiota bacterium]